MAKRRPALDRPEQLRPGRRLLARAVVPAALVLFTGIAYAPVLRAPFIGDDYVFLDETCNASFVDLWSRRHVAFGWYRPWSRELHFWALQRLFGPHEPGFRIASLFLWLVGLGLYLAFLRRAAGGRVATVAALGVASLSLWGAPLAWNSGVQDLWMLLFVLLTLLLIARGSVAWPWASFVAALLSKETAAVLPLLVLAQARWIERLDARATLRRVGPFAGLTLAWMLVHPVLIHRLAHPEALPATGDVTLPPWVGLGRSMLSLINCDQLLLPRDPDAARPVATVVSASMLALAAFWELRRHHETAPARASRAGLVRFGATWCAAGWLPLLSPSIGWHAYYGSLGALGAWIILATVLVDQRRFAVGSLFVLGLLRGAAETARSWDWGSQWFQARAGNMLHLIHDQLLSLHPTLPRHSRLYFGSVPNNVGLIAGDSPAVRVWYGDSTMRGGFYSAYRPRALDEPRGPDLFFHFDSTTGIRDVSVDGAEGETGPAWERDHESLAMTLVSAGDLPRAATLFEAIARLPHRADALMFGGVCREASGDTVLAAADYARAGERTGRTSREIEAWASRLRASMPRPSAVRP